MDAVVTRLHEALVDAVRSTRGDVDLPVSVAEIYQELIPYRTVRSLIGVEMNADYEYALLRLLAGEGGFARIEPAEAREALRLEIGSPNPNVSLYRKFAGCDVWLDTSPSIVRAPRAEQAIMREAADVDTSTEPAESASPVAEPVHSRFAFIDDRSDEPAPSFDSEDEGEFDDEIAVSTDWQSEPDDVASCRYCNQPLPTGRTVNFCPYCGGDQRSHPCPSCGEVLQPDWRFCPSCGATVAGGTSSA